VSSRMPERRFWPEYFAEADTKSHWREKFNLLALLIPLLSLLGLSSCFGSALTNLLITSENFTPVNPTISSGALCRESHLRRRFRLCDCLGRWRAVVPSPSPAAAKLWSVEVDPGRYGLSVRHFKDSSVSRFRIDPHPGGHAQNIVTQLGT
jgi:hypothetical protein